MDRFCGLRIRPTSHKPTGGSFERHSLLEKTTRGRSSGFLLKLLQQYDTCLEFSSTAGILGITGLGYVFEVTESIFSNLCKHFLNIKTLFCWHIVNKCTPKARYFVI
jgi:hypothetical protein